MLALKLYDKEHPVSVMLPVFKVSIGIMDKHPDGVFNFCRTGIFAEPGMGKVVQSSRCNAIAYSG
jgi:hypothetical protein